MMKKLLLIFQFTIIFTTLNAQDLIHYWHFNNVNTTIDSVAADSSQFAPTLPLIIYRESVPGVVNKGYMDDVNGSAINARNNEPDGNGIRPRNPSDSMELFIELPTTGFEDVILNYAVQRSGSGMLKEVIFYTIDGINYVSHPDTVFVTTNFELATIDFSGISGVNNNPDFSIIIKFFEQNTASNGNNRIDNLTLEGYPINTTLEMVHYWNFNTASGNIDSIQADFSVATMAPYIIYQDAYPNVVTTGYMDDVSGTTINARNGDLEGRGIRPRNPSDSMELVIQLPSTGYKDLKLSYASERSGSGMLKQVLYYTTDGVNYISHPDTVVVATSYSLVEFDLSDITASNDNADFEIKMKFFEQNTASNGNNRIDNLVLEGVSLGGAVEGVEISENSLVLGVGQSDSLWAMVLPGNATNKDVSWMSTDNSIVTVDQEGRLNALAQGMAMIIVTTDEGGFADTCEVEVISLIDITLKITSGGNDISNASVIIEGEEKFTNASGETIFNLLPGNYDIAVSADGYISETKNIAIAVDTVIAFDLRELSAEVIHYWHFNNMPLGTVTALPVDYTLLPDLAPTITYEGVGNGYMDDYSTGSALNAKFGTEAGVALRVRNRSHEKALIIPLPSTECEDLMLSFDIHRSGSGMLINHFEYTLDGGATYDNTGIVPAQINVTEDYVTHVIDFSAVTGANNNPDFGVRITWEGNTEQDNGNNRYDNIALTAVTSLEIAVDEKSRVNEVKLFPNPTNNNVFIANAQIGSEYRITNYNGQLIESGVILNNNQMLNTSSHLSNGFYFVVLVENDVTRVLKFIVAK